jgi:hypothetical protein
MAAISTKKRVARLKDKLEAAETVYLEHRLSREKRHLELFGSLLKEADDIANTNRTRLRIMAGYHDFRWASLFSSKYGLMWHRSFCAAVGEQKLQGENAILLADVVDYPLIVENDMTILDLITDVLDDLRGYVRNGGLLHEKVPLTFVVWGKTTVRLYARENASFGSLVERALDLSGDQASDGILVEGNNNGFNRHLSVLLQMETTVREVLDCTRDNCKFFVLRN